MAKTLILWLDHAQERRTLTDDEARLRKQLKFRTLGLASFERNMARQRSRLLFLKDGDANSRLFHMQASYRLKKRFISKLEHNGVTALTHEQKEEQLLSYFQAIMGTPSVTTEAIDILSLDMQACDLSQLDAPFSEREIWDTIRSLPNERAPSPNGSK